MLITKKSYKASSHKIEVTIKLDDPESLTWGIYLLLSDSQTHKRPFVDWGDGSFGVPDSDWYNTHEYAKPGIYKVVIYTTGSNQIAISGIAVGSPFLEVYPKRVIGFKGDAPSIQLSTYCFAYQTELQNLEINSLDYARGLSGVLFRDCTKLSGAINLRGVKAMDEYVFEGCDKITEFHFLAANEESIKNSPGYSDGPGNFGAPNAVCVFDLT